LKTINLSYRATLVISLTAAAFLYAINFDCVQIGIIQDDAHYINAARWLAGTQTIQKALDAYPLAYSLMLVPAAKLFPESVNVFKVFNIFLFLLIIPVLYGIFKDYLPNSELLVFLLLTSLNPLMVQYSSLVLPAGAFLLVSLVSFYLIQKASLKDSPPCATLASAAFLTAYLCAIRFEGFLFATAVILGLILAKRIRHALYFTFFYVILTAAYIHFSTAFTVSGGRFFGYMFDGIHGGGIYDILRKTSVFYFIEFTYSIFLTAFIGEKLGGFALIPAILVFAIFVRGFLGKKKFEGEIILKIYFVLYVLLHLPWPTRYTKFFLALLPFIIFYFMAGAQKFGRKTAYTFFTGIFIFFLYNGIKTSGNRVSMQSPETLSFIRTSTSPDAVFISIDASRVFLYTNRKSAYSDEVSKDDDMLYSLVKTGADYVYVDLFNESKDYMYLGFGKTPNEKIIQCMDDKNLYSLVYKNENAKTFVWRVNDGVKENFMEANDHALKAKKFFKDGDTVRAKEAYAKAFKIFPYYARAVNNYALIYMDEGNFAKAETILIEGILYSPRSAMLHALYGRLCKMKGEYDKSAEFYKKALVFAADFDDTQIQRLAESELSILKGRQDEK